MLNFPGAPKVDPGDITGSVHGAPKEAKKEEEPKPAAPDTKPEGVVIHPEENQQPVSAVGARDPGAAAGAPAGAGGAPARDRHPREPAEGGREADRVQGRGDEGGSRRATAAANEQKAEAENARFKGIITMYEGMKPKDAAKVFDRLDMAVLIEIASQIAPRKMSDILGLMQPDAAERLTVELARRAGGDKSRPAPSCPRSKARSCRKRAGERG